MQTLTLFHLAGCPYCRAAKDYIAALQKEYPALRDVQITCIDEKLHPEIAETYDYWFVPTFYLGQEKLHEGACTREIVEGILRKALEE